MNQMQQMLMQAQRMQRELAKARAALAEQEFKAAKGGMVELVMLGDRSVKSLSIDEAALEPDNKEQLGHFRDSLRKEWKDATTAWQDVNAASDNRTKNSREMQ